MIPDSWPASCKGHKQSPIEIKDSLVQVVNEPSKKLKLVNYFKSITSKVKNDGHTGK